MNDLRLRDYDIVFTEDYMRLIRLLLKDLSRRGISPTGTYIEYLQDEKVNRVNVIDYIITNLKKVAYATNETYGIVLADQMKRAQAQLVTNSDQIVNTTKGVSQMYAGEPDRTLKPLVVIGSDMTFANQSWKCMHVFMDASKNKYAIIRLNNPFYKPYHNTNCGYWSSSNLRAYLEGEFFNAIPASDQARIVPVINVTSYAGDYYAVGVQNTTDKVWLESYTNILGNSWIGSNTGAVRCDEPTAVAGVQIKKFMYFDKMGGQIGTGIMRRLRTTGGTRWNMGCPATGTTINTKNNGDYFGTTTDGACYPCVCIKL